MERGLFIIVYPILSSAMQKVYNLGPDELCDSRCFYILESAIEAKSYNKPKLDVWFSCPYALCIVYLPTLESCLGKSWYSVHGLYIDM